MQKTNYTEEYILNLICTFNKHHLPKRKWTHHAHLFVGIYYAIHFDEYDAIKHLRKSIIKHNESVGTPNTDSEGYHETITYFWFQVINEFISKNSRLKFIELCNAFINTNKCDPSYIFQFYSKKLLFTKKARNQIVQPDLTKIC